MILSRVAIQGCGCFRNPVELDGLGLGAHLIYAPNESGKSTLITAIARAFFDRYNTRDRDIEALRPWGTKLSPQITLEFDAAGKTYKLEKGFLDSARSDLYERTATGAFERLAEAQEADALVRDFFLASASGKGATNLGHWGLARLLWLTQHADRHTPPEWDEPVRQRLVHLVGDGALGTRELALLEAIDGAYAEFYTPTGRAKRGVKGSPLEIKAAEVETLARALAELRRRYEATWDYADRAGQYDRELATLTADERFMLEALAALQDRADEEAKIERTLERFRNDHARLVDQCQALQEKLDALAGLEQQITRARQSIADIEPRLESAESRHAAAQAATAAAHGALRHARAAETDAAAALDRGRSITEAQRLQGELLRLRNLQTRAHALQDQLTAAREAAAVPAPSDRQIVEAQDLAQRIDADRATLRAAGLQVQFMPIGEFAATWKSDDGSETRAASPSQPLILHAVDRGQLTIEGVGTLDISAGATDARELQMALQGRIAELASMLGEYGAADVEGFRRLRQEAELRAAEVQRVERSLADLLGGGTLDATAAAVRKAEGQRAALAAQLGIDVAAFPTAEAPDLDALHLALREARDRRSAAERALESAQATEDVARTEAEDIRRQLADLTIALEQNRRLLDSQVASAGDLDALKGQLKDAASQQQLLKMTIEGLDEQLPPTDQRAGRRTEQLRTTLENTRARIQEIQLQKAGAEALLEQAAQEGLYSRLAQAEERHAIAVRELEHLEQRAQGVKLLRDLAHTRKVVAGDGVIGPLEAKVSEQLGFLRGGSASVNGDGARPLVHLDADLKTVQLPTAHGEGAAALQQFSWGTQEQTMLALRLSLGLLFAQEEPQLVVLDDALVNTDGGRHSRALELIAAAAGKLQILILTAFPDRYRELPAKRYDLLALRQATATASVD
ncbi:MAG TPA: AAA family ATPase [bacterium]|nr:AAA family ATPase [bacterium]